jgi:hypothetical protein
MVPGSGTPRHKFPATLERHPDSQSLLLSAFPNVPRVDSTRRKHYFLKRVLDNSAPRPMQKQSFGPFRITVNNIRDILETGEPRITFYLNYRSIRIKGVRAESLAPIHHRT